MLSVSEVSFVLRPRRGVAGTSSFASASFPCLSISDDSDIVLRRLVRGDFGVSDMASRTADIRLDFGRDGVVTDVVSGSSAFLTSKLNFDELRLMGVADELRFVTEADLARVDFRPGDLDFDSRWARSTLKELLRLRRAGFETVS